jgi:hypothetical protein
MPRNAFQFGLAAIVGIATTGCIYEQALPPEQLNLAPSSLDGGRTVANGKPTLAFQYPGSGRLAIRNMTENSLIYSLDLPTNTAIPGGVLVRIDAEKRAVITITGGNEVVVVPKIDVNDRYVITYVASEVPATPKR